MKGKIKALKFFTDILRGRITYDGKVVPVYTEHTERLEPPFITFRIQKNRRLPRTYNYKIRDESGAITGRLQGFFDVYMVNIVIFTTSIKMRDSIISQVKEIIDKVQFGHYEFCLNYDPTNYTCKTTGQECDAHKIHQPDDFEASCPYSYQEDPSKTDYRGPVGPMQEYDISNYVVKDFVHFEDYSEKGPLYTTLYNVEVTVAEIYESTATPIRKVEIRGD